MLFSESYLDETLALMEPDHRRDQFASWDAIRNRGAITILTPDQPVLHRQAARACTARRHQGSVPGQADPAHHRPERGRGLPARRTRLCLDADVPGVSVVVPGPEPIRVPLAFPIGRRDEQFARFINTWIALKRKDATLNAAYKRWILGQDAAARQPRWSIIRNVLHWVG